MEPVPACIQNSRYDILADNRTYARLMMRDLERRPPQDRTYYLAYTHPEWRESIVLLDETMRVMAAEAVLDGRPPRRARLEAAGQATADGVGGVP